MEEELEREGVKEEGSEGEGVSFWARMVSLPVSLLVGCSTWFPSAGPSYVSSLCGAVQGTCTVLAVESGLCV